MIYEQINMQKYHKNEPNTAPLRTKPWELDQDRVMR